MVETHVGLPTEVARVGRGSGSGPTARPVTSPLHDEGQAGHIGDPRLVIGPRLGLGEAVQVQRPHPELVGPRLEDSEPRRPGNPAEGKGPDARPLRHRIEEEDVLGKLAIEPSPSRAGGPEGSSAHPSAEAHRGRRIEQPSFPVLADPVRDALQPRGPRRYVPRVIGAPSEELRRVEMAWRGSSWATCGSCFLGEVSLDRYLGRRSVHQLMD